MYGGRVVGVVLDGAGEDDDGVIVDAVAADDEFNLSLFV